MWWMTTNVGWLSRTMRDDRALPAAGKGPYQGDSGDFGGAGGMKIELFQGDCKEAGA